MMTEMEEFLKILLSLSFSGTFLFLIVFLVVQMYRNRLSRRWQYYIWLLVVFRFLIPLTFPHTVTGYLFQGVEQAVEGRNAGNAADAAENAVRKDIQESAVDEMEDDSADAAAGMADDSKENVGGQETAPAEGTASDALTVSFQEAADSRRMPAFSFWVFGIWAAGAFGLLVRKITIYQSYMQFLRKGNTEVSDLETLNILAEAEEKLRIKRAIELFRNPLVTSPIMTGFIRPKIVIPDKKMTNGELACIFAHELVHFKYFDMFYKWLVQITICVHWFNPFVWLLGKEVNKHCELSCDEKVIGALNEQERKNYGDTLLSFLKRGETYQSPLASITLTEGAEQLIERLGAIMDYQKKTRTIMILTTALTVLLCFFFSGIGAYAGARAGQQSVGQENGLEQQNAGQENGLVQQNAEQENGLVQQNAEQENAPAQHNVESTGNGGASDAVYAREEQEEQQDIDYDLLYDEEAHSYYILIDGATLADRPIGGTTGGIGIVLVRKSGYTSFTFDSLSVKFGFLDEVESQCEDALEKGMISETEAELILDVAVAIEEGTDVPEAEEEKHVSQTVQEMKENNYAYYQQGFYEAPYLIWIGWNLSEEYTAYYARTEITLDDQSRMDIYFSKEAEAWMDDAAAMEVVSRLTGELKTSARRRYGIEMEIPYISQMTYLPPEEVEDFAKRAFDNDDIANFSVVVDKLPEDLKEEYCERSHAEDDISFFSIIISEMNADYVKAFVERCYENDEIDYFAVAADDLTSKDRKNLMEKALQEGNVTYYDILKNKEDWGY